MNSRRPARAARGRAAAFLVLVAGLTLFGAACGPAGGADGLQTPFTIWMMNNESRTLALLAADRRLVDALSMGNGMLLAARPPWPKPENRFWRLHLQFFSYLEEINQVYRTARQFGSGELARLITSVHPGEWGTVAFHGVPAWRAREIAPFLNDFCGTAFMAVLGIDQSRDGDLAGRLARAVKMLTDTDRRMLSQYFDTFLALYPKNAPVRRLVAFLQSGLKKNVTQGVAALVAAKPAGGADEAAALLADLASTAGGESASVTVDPALLAPDALPEDLGTGTMAASEPAAAGEPAAAEEPAETGPTVDVFNILGNEGEPASGTK